MADNLEKRVSFIEKVLARKGLMRLRSKPDKGKAKGTVTGDNGTPANTPKK